MALGIRSQENHDCDLVIPSAMSCGPEGFLHNEHLCFLFYKQNKVRQGSIFEFTTLKFEPLDLQTKNDLSTYAVYLIWPKLIKNLFIQIQMNTVLNLQGIFPVTSSPVSFRYVSKECLRPPREGGKHWPSMTCIPNPHYHTAMVLVRNSSERILHFCLVPESSSCPKRHWSHWNPTHQSEGCLWSYTILICLLSSNK